MAVATSDGITRLPTSGSLINFVSYGVSAAKCSVSMRSVGMRMPSLRMVPINSPSAAGRSPELPRAVASDGTR
ncbi:hypothetical protein D3C85_1744600 [compost metagenome]